MWILGVRRGVSDEISPLVSEVQLPDVSGWGRHAWRSMDRYVDMICTARPSRVDHLKFGNATRTGGCSASKEGSVFTKSVGWIFSKRRKQISGQERWHSPDQTSTIVLASGLQVVMSMRPTSRTSSRPLFMRYMLILSFWNRSWNSHSWPLAISEVIGYVSRIREISRREYIRCEAYHSGNVIFWTIYLTMVKLLRKEAYLWEHQELECKSSGESKHALIKNFRLWNRESNIRWQAQNRWNASPGHASQHERHWIYWLQQSSLVAISPSLC